jgi:hypothetical protein
MPKEYVLLSVLSRPRTRRSAGPIVAATLFGPAVAATSLSRPGPAFAYNCVNVVLRDPYWGQFRRVIESGSNAAGVAPSLARHGFLVNGTPSVGAVISWPPGYYGASGVGHVGVVAAVNDNGTVLVRHENWPYGTGEKLQVFPQRPAFQYVHRPDALAAQPAEPAGAVREVQPVAAVTNDPVGA